MVTCLDLAMVNLFAGASSVMIDPEPIVENSKTFTGAIKKTPEPINAFFLIIVF